MLNVWILIRPCGIFASGRAVERSAASTCVMSRLETEMLSQPKILEFLMSLPGRWDDGTNEGKGVKEIVLVMDSSVAPTHGNLEGSAYRIARPTAEKGAGL